MLLPDGGLFRIGTLGIVPTVANVVRGDRAIVVEVGFVVGNKDWIGNIGQPGSVSNMLLELTQVAPQKSKLRSVIVGRQREREAVFRIAGQNQSEIVGLDQIVPGARRGKRTMIDFREQTMVVVC